ncbi:DUF397 domain-containing protein [Streptomyces ureilyticus]|uniref:DUF397 domain-containing protein n=1 Tax=Streptomyces ureilyticus TaxID=1775131 RepID=A0ABX0E8H6_9ACTN|nr:DUF397 domain-containing protein [Streptomyces ureilyticus]NGO47911.1 DUF397 domain-containing protein [Streptomyces ureilyticus]
MSKHTRWQKSSYCGQGDSCVHIAIGTARIHLTESGDSTGAILDAAPAAFSALLHTLKHKDETHRG